MQQQQQQQHIDNSTHRQTSPHTTSKPEPSTIRRECAVWAWCRAVPGQTIAWTMWRMSMGGVGGGACSLMSCSGMVAELCLCRAGGGRLWVTHILLQLQAIMLNYRCTCSCLGLLDMTTTSPVTFVAPGAGLPCDH